MLVLIMRHGDAEASRGMDGQRHLTKLGAAQSRKVLKLASDIGAKVTAIASSPLLRARETAEIASQVFGLEFLVTNSLEPEGTPDEVYAELESYHATNSVLLISHQPLVSKLLADILGAEPVISFATASLALIKVKNRLEAGCGTLVCMIPPQLPES